MKKTSLATLACIGLLTPACIIVADDDGSGGNDDAVETDGEVIDDDDDDDDAGTDGGSEGGTDGDTEGEDEGEELVCGDEVLLDPGFEGGTPNESWDESSELFESPLCDGACSTDEGAGAHAGDWYAWFGGVDEPELAWIGQRFILDADIARLSFQFQINAASGSGEDFFRVVVDDQEVFAASDAEIEDYGGWTRVELDLSDFADGQRHDLYLEAELAGGGVTSFFVDDVSLVGCAEAPAGDDDETGDDTGGETDGETGADESGETGADESGETGADESGDESGGESGDGSGGESGDAG